MKNNVTNTQVKDYLLLEDNIITNLIKLGKAVRVDYEALYEYNIIFERKKPIESLNKVINECVCVDFTIDRMVHILENKGIEIPEGKENDCDYLWFLLTSNLK